MNSPGFVPAVPVPRPSSAPKIHDANIILCVVENMMYPITEEAIKTVVSVYGEVVKTVIYEQPGVWQAVVQYADANSAKDAKQALDGHAIYEGGYNKLRVFQSSKETLSFATASIASPDYKSMEQENSAARVVVDGDDYVRAHSDIGRGAMACLSGQALPACFIPSSIPSPEDVAAIPPMPQMMGPMYVTHAQYYAPEPRRPMHHGMMAGPYSQIPIPMNSQQLHEARYPHTIPMTTYQQRSMAPRAMWNYSMERQKSHGFEDERMK